jgi:hypothetical protein
LSNLARGRGPGTHGSGDPPTQVKEPQLIDATSSVNSVDRPGVDVPGSEVTCRLQKGLRLVVILFAVLDFCLHRNVMYSDGISYLEIADRYKTGDWARAVNAYWSPLYSWVLALTTRPLSPGSYYEVYVVHLVNLAALLASMLAFERLLRELKISGRGLMVAYALFLWGALGLLDTGLPTPDLLTTVVVYLLAGLTVRFRRRRPGVLGQAGLGLIVAVGYFAKAAMLPIGFFYLVTASLAARHLLIVAGLACLLTIAPWVVALRMATGMWTIGTSGSLNYAWEIHGVGRSTHWQGETFGPALHPTRRLPTTPPVFEYAGALDATYPPWYDPSYWYAGLRIRFSLAAQLRGLIDNSLRILMFIAVAPGLLVGLILFRSAVLAVPEARLILIPAIGSIALFTLVFVEPRYVAAQLVLIGLSVAIGWRDRPLSRLRARLIVGTAVATCLPFLVVTAAAGIFLLIQLSINPQLLRNPHWHIAQELKAFGIQPGERIAYIGLPISAYWARLLGVRIVAEVPLQYDREQNFWRKLRLRHPDVDAFWRADTDSQRRILDTFAGTGARSRMSCPHGPARSGGPGFRRWLGSMRYQPRRTFDG